MGMLQDGKWVDQWIDTSATKGRFVRKETDFRNWITKDGEAGPTGNAGFKAEAERYHLYVSYACPWAHRTLIFRALKGLKDMITTSVVHWHMGENGWTFAPGEGVVPDSINRSEFLYQVYTTAEGGYSGRVSVPVLWDKKTNSIVSNESADIIRMFNSEFDEIGAKEGDYYPEELREDIDAVNTRIYDTVNNGVYKAGFAGTQEAYEEAITPLFETLDWLEERLSTQRYLFGNSQITEADWRLFTTLVRFDPVYVGHFKCNLRRIRDYVMLWGYVRDLYSKPGVAETVNFFHIKQHYYGSHTALNPSGIVPSGPTIDYTEAHGRIVFF
ncbi:glutathione S-transferase family protein [Cochlodiniinecator piscidefendens]|uniref:glutathione S-transferase family protein n=1 Tax=Cochlodiniinecator piscidefendens TaxID=2715756 RepID=UPI001409E7A4|nr:glutathione S-transferase family protein [Cochlodiniinecator piscidefendens]